MNASPPLRCQTCGLVLRSGTTACPFRDTRRPSGTVLLPQGVTPDTVIYLRRGQVVLSSTAVSGAEVSCAVRGPDTLLGLELLLSQPMPYQVWALTDVAYCVLERAQAEAWLGDRSTPAGAALIYALEEASRRVGERQALQGPARRRVARFLLQQSQTDAGGEPFETQHVVLAGMLGMRPETLSRAFAELRAAGVLARGRAVRVANPKRLQELAE